VLLFDEDDIDSTERNSDGDALQTDVMRFIAIIAFCLLVIFIPIVQSIPREVTKKVPILIEENKSLSRRLTQLDAEIGGQLLVIESLNDAVQLKNKRIQELESLEKNLRTRKSERDQLQDALSLNMSKVPRLKEQIKTLEQNNVIVKNRLREIQKKIKVSKIFSHDTKILEKKPKNIEKINPPKVDIVFASRKALLELVQSDQVSIFLLISGYGFQLQYQNGNMTYRRLDQISGFRYTMPNSRIPGAIHRASRKYLGNILRGSPRYEIKLSSSIQKNLTNSLNRHSSGKFIITRTGGVEHEPLS